MESSKMEKVFNILKQLRMEPFLFLVMFAFSIKDINEQNLILDRVCSVHLGWSEDTCKNMKDNEDDYNTIQQIASNYKVGLSLARFVPAIISATLLGPWSDKYGRKFPLLASVFGMILEGIGAIVIVAIPSAPIYALILTAIPSGIFGGIIMALTSTYSYLSDITDVESRALRYAILEFVFIIANPLAIVIGGQIYKYSTYVVIYVVAEVILAMAFCWVIFVVKETRGKEEEKNIKVMLSHLFSLDNLKDCFKTCTAPRPGTIRAQIWLVTTAVGLLTVFMFGSMTTGFYFASRMYGWDNPKYSTVTAIVRVLHGIGLILIVPIFTKTLRIPDGMLGFFGTISYMGECILKSMGYYEWMYYYGYVIGSPAGVGSVAARSHLSKLVFKDELGKVFSLMALNESLAPILGIVIYNEIYAASVATFPGACYLFSSIGLIFPAAIFLWINKQPTPPEFNDENERGYRMESFAEFTVQ